MVTVYANNLYEVLLKTIQATRKPVSISKLEE